MNSKFSCSFFYYFFILLLFTTTLLAQTAPAELINIEKLDDSLQIRIAYSTKINFTQKKIDGYSKNICFLKEGAALGIVKVNSILKKQTPSYRIVLRDCWRPHRATLDMIQWAEETDQRKLSFNDLSPFQKNTFQDLQLFEKGILKTERLLALGYLSSLSNHSRGSTVDLEVEYLDDSSDSWTYLDMGTTFDTFSERSAHFADLGNTINQRRSHLKHLMNENGFSSLAKEWWHWTHRASNESPVLDGEIR